MSNSIVYLKNLRPFSDSICRKLQSTGISGRSLEDLVHLIAPSFRLPWQATARPQRVIYPTDFAPLLSKKQLDLMGEFVAAWEKAIDVKADNISLADAWAKNPPREAGKQTLHDYLGHVSKDGCFSTEPTLMLMQRQAAYSSFCHDFYRNYDEFRSAFKAKFDEAPYLEPNVAEEW